MSSRYAHLLHVRKQDPHNTFIVSDTHFGHANIIKYCKRPFSSVEEMDEELIRRWNAVVPRDGVVWHLGDLGKARATRLCEILDRLHGHKMLILGNHDRGKWGIKDVVLDKFEFVGHYAELQFRDQFVTVAHYPLETWNGSHHGSWSLHGHCHGGLANRGLRMDVGVDGHPPDVTPTYAPRTYQEIVDIMIRRRDEITMRIIERRTP